MGCPVPYENGYLKYPGPWITHTPGYSTVFHPLLRSGQDCLYIKKTNLLQDPHNRTVKVVWRGGSVLPILIFRACKKGSSPEFEKFLTREPIESLRNKNFKTYTFFIDTRLFYRKAGNRKDFTHQE